MKFGIGIFAVAATGLLLLSAGGCASNKLQAQVDTLTSQNKQLNDELKAEQQARVAAEARASAQLQTPAEVGTPGMGGGIVDLTGPGAAHPQPIRGTGAAAGNSGTRATTPVSNRAAAPTKVSIPGNILFASGKVTLDATATKTLDGIAATIKSKYAGQKLVIEGYTDATPPSKGSVWTSNADLATARGNAVKKYLAKKGIKESEMTVKAMPASGAASSPSSRRVEVAVLK